jgi:hypothetical protein
MPQPAISPLRMRRAEGKLGDGMEAPEAVRWVRRAISGPSTTSSPREGKLLSAPRARTVPE